MSMEHLWPQYPRVRLSVKVWSLPQFSHQLNDHFTQILTRHFCSINERFISLVPRNWTADDFVITSQINMVRKLWIIFFFSYSFFFIGHGRLEDSLQPTTNPSWLPSIVSLKIDSAWCSSVERCSCSRFVNASRCQVLFWWGQEEELIRIVSLIWVGTKS
jgi:hypothetical protein